MIQSLMTQCGLSHSWRYEQTVSGFLTIICVITHSEGHSEQTPITLPHDTSGSKNAIQALGSTSSYGERYTLFAMLGLASAPDDDGQAGAPGAPQPLSKARKAQQARQTQNPPDQQPTPASGPDQTPQATTPQAEPPGLAEFRENCDVMAVACEVLQPEEHLTSAEYKALFQQANALCGGSTLADATQYIRDGCRAIVRDAAGIRVIAQ